MRLMITAAILATGCALAACSSSGTHSSGTPAPSGGSAATAGVPGTGHASIGSLRITDAYVPQQASPDVAAAYFVVTNDGATADELTRVTSSVTSDITAMTETDNGSSGSMTDLTRVVVPAHGSFTFRPGRQHLMLEKPSKQLRQGDHVTLTLTFARAGTVRLVVPVTGFGGPADGGASMVPGTTMSGMTMSGTTMSGMTMSGMTGGA